MIALSTVRDQLFTAVKSLAELNKLISAMKLSVDNTIQLKAELGGLYTMSTGVSRAIALGNEIPLVTMFNEQRAATATIETETYTSIMVEPSDWATSYASYYKIDSDGAFVASDSTFAAGEVYEKTT